ncbi:unnamed protein product [Brassicogethes aeneus]|uniref:separase n=1 Tax=Brassicogethes aeneus TaxID=1431903 RepID=A0A9P0FGA3_BRAAE|nr:unnamed protein product [Brassicogethes aeneus]
MDGEPDWDDVTTLLKEFEGVHYKNSTNIQKILRYKTQQCNIENELESIYNLTESHSLALRINTTVKWEKNEKNQSLLDNVMVKCSNSNIDKNINELINKLKVLPKEWTLVQLTSEFEADDNLNFKCDKYNTPGIHISVFTCGKRYSTPFMVSVDHPKDPVNGSKLELLNEIHCFLRQRKELLKEKACKKNIHRFIAQRSAAQDKLQSIILDTQNLWLREWRCLLVGNLVDENVENNVLAEIEGFLNKNPPDETITEKTMQILLSAVKSAGYLKNNELKRIMQHLFSNADLIKKSAQFIKTLSSKFDIKNLQKNSVILIVDDALDIIPWELVDTLSNEPVSRLPSLHFVFSLFDEHKDDIKDGFKIITEYKKGLYIVNPDEDLKNMEIRIMNFFTYWCPEWTGIAGYKPSDEEFYEHLTSSDIFSYNGHGSGSQHMTTERIQNVHVKAIVLLFGCSSTKIERLGSQLGYHAKYYNYLMARCPSVVGMLWEVMDIDTDVITTEFLSQWIPSDAPIHWKHVNKTKWKKAEQEIKFSLDETLVTGCVSLEPELLRALCLAKKEVQQLITKAACVVRGIPVKIEVK